MKRDKLLPNLFSQGGPKNDQKESEQRRDFFGGAVLKTQPSTVGGMGLIPAWRA